MFVIVDTNVLLSHLSSTERTLERLVGAALEARWVRHPRALLPPSLHSACSVGGMRILH